MSRRKASHTIKQTVACMKESQRAVRRNVDLATTAHKVINTRMTSSDGSELLRMVPEKLIAFSGAWITYVPQALLIGFRFGPSTPAWSSLWSARNPWQFWQRSLSYAVPLATALMQAQGAMIATLQDTVMRNQRRLSGRSKQRGVSPPTVGLDPAPVPTAPAASSTRSRPS